jgi:hypothetical protein
VEDPKTFPEGSTPYGCGSIHEKVLSSLSSAMALALHHDVCRFVTALPIFTYIEHENRNA